MNYGPESDYIRLFQRFSNQIIFVIVMTVRNETKQMLFCFQMKLDLLEILRMMTIKGYI